MKNISVFSKRGATLADIDARLAEWTPKPDIFYADMPDFVLDVPAIYDIETRQCHNGDDAVKKFLDINVPRKMARARVTKVEKIEKPVTKVEKIEKPVAKVEKIEKPVAKVEKIEKPVAKAEKPVTKAEKPVDKPVEKIDKPAEKIEKAVEKIEKPAEKIEKPKAKRGRPKKIVT